MSRIVIQTITVECVNQTSNKFYEVVLVVHWDKLVLETSYGGKNSKPKQGKGGSFVVPDVASTAGSREFENRVASLVSDANTILKSKIKKGYTGRQTAFDPIVVLGRIYNHFPSSAAAKVSSPQTDAATASAPVLNGISVEVIGISASRIKIAKVLGNYDYEVLGEVANPLTKPIRIGDVVQVVQSAGGYTLQ